MVGVLLTFCAFAIAGVISEELQGTLSVTKLSGQAQTVVVARHNEYRNLIASGEVDTQPEAENMELMIWDDELATQAYNWARHGLFEHDPNLAFYPAGQNLYIIKGTSVKTLKTNLTEAVDSWFNELYTYGYDGTFNQNIGHYSQIIWGTSSKIGCAVNQYMTQEKKTYSNPKKWYHVYLVCNYFRPGNVIGHPPYIYGRVDCKKHGMVNSKVYPYLCKKVLRIAQ